VTTATAAAPAPVKPGRRSRERIPYSLISLAIGAVLWETVGRFADVPFFPPLSVVLVNLVELVASGSSA
jgi:hypothetical protein